MAEHTSQTNTTLSKPHSFSSSSSSEYTLLMNRFKLLNLVKRIAHRDVLAMIETIGLDGLHYKCATKQSWMTDWNMNADHDEKKSNKESRQNSYADKSTQKQASRVNSGKMETKKFSNMEHELPHNAANKVMTNSFAQKHKQIHKTHTDAQRRNANTQPTLIHHRHQKAFHDRNVDKDSNVDVTWSSSPRLTEDEINELVQRLAQPRESYTIDMDDTSFTTEEDMFDESNTNFMETGDNTFKMNRVQEVDKNKYKMSNVQPATSSITPHEPTWKQLQMATGLMESTPLPLHPHKHKVKWNKEQKDKESTIATITASSSANNATLTSSPRPRSRTRQREEEEEEEEWEQKQETVENDYKDSAVGSNNREYNVMRDTPLTLQNAKNSNAVVSTPSQETQETEERLEHHMETMEHLGSIQEDAYGPTANNNTRKMDTEVNTLPITPTRAIAPKAKPIAVHNTERVPTNIIQHAAALVARQREQRQMELNKRQWQMKQQASKKEEEKDDNKNVKELASTQRYLPTEQNTIAEKNEEEKEQEQEIPPSARSYSVAHGHDVDKLFATGHSNTGNNDDNNINNNNSNKDTENTEQNEPTNMSKNTAAEVATTPSLLPRATFADQRTLAKLSNTIDHMLRDHEHILHEVIADHDKIESIKLQTENTIEKEKIAAMSELSRESEEEKNSKERKIEKKKKHVKSLQGRHLHRFSTFANNNNNNNHGKQIKELSRASTSSFTSSSLSSERGEDVLKLRLSGNNHNTSRKDKYIRQPSRCTSTDTITSSTATTTETSDSVDKHKDDDELLMLSRMQRTFAEMDNETHDIIARTNRARVPVIDNNGLLQTNNVNVKSADKLHANKANQPPVISSSFSSLPVRTIAHRRRGQMPEVAVRRLNAYRVENLERIAREERRWNTSNISQFTFASKLTNALFEDCFDEVMSEVNSIMDNYVDGLAEHEMAERIQREKQIQKK